jgi:hypothetical protein
MKQRRPRAMNKFDSAALMLATIVTFTANAFPQSTRDNDWIFARDYVEGTNSTANVATTSVPVKNDLRHYYPCLSLALSA